MDLLAGPVPTYVAVKRGTTTSIRDGDPISTVTSSDGTPIAFSRTGTGPPIIVVDGAFAHRAINPTAPKLAALLAPHFTVYTYDRRGRGESGETPPYALAREIEDLAALIAEAGGSALVLGGSSGGMLALDAAADELPIMGAAVYEPPVVVDDSCPRLPDDYLTRLGELPAAERQATRRSSSLGTVA